MADTPAYPPPEQPSTRVVRDPGTPRGRSSGRGGGALGWIIGAAIVLVLAVAGGLLTAWVVANMRAVPGPVGAASPTPAARPSLDSSAGPGGSAGASEAPRRTPTPAPTVTVSQEPFVHVVGLDESLFYIATLYGVTVEEIIELNDIRNPDRIRVGRELLIPGHGVRPSDAPG